MNERLMSMLSWKRPHDSKTERTWIETFIAPTGAENLNSKAYHLTVEAPDGAFTPVLFSSHTDTVHRTEGPQEVVFDPISQFVAKIDGEPLGADDGAGVWLMLEMIDAGVPGTYLFHRGEERGGIGSSWMAEHYDKWLGQFTHAIAFDRRGTDSVVTHQMRGRCCSDEFANALAEALNAGDAFMYSPDDTGTYTDTAEYTHLIPECTNVSVGYYNEHSPNEKLDVLHLNALRDACLKIDWAALPVSRDPLQEDLSDYQSSYPYKYGHDLTSMEYDDLAALAEADPAFMAEQILELVEEYLRLQERYDMAFN